MIGGIAMNGNNRYGQELIVADSYKECAGGAFGALDACGILRYMLGRVYHRFSSKKYTLLVVVTLFFMLLGTFAGSFEEAVPLVPLAAALSYAMGWDALLGLGMSVLAVCCGFSSAIGNPFTVGIAQQLAGLPMFSGMWYRAVGFVVFFAVLLFFLVSYAKKIEKNPDASPVYDPAKEGEWKSLQLDISRERQMDYALYAFCGCLGAGIGAILLSTFLTVLQDYLMIIVALAFLLMPLITPVAQLSGISLQVAVLAFAFGDGFSNTFYPTNPVLLISLGLSGVSYGKWVRWSIKLQLPVLVITAVMLLAANGFGY